MDRLLKNKIRRLTRAEYFVKHSPDAGWWVEGRRGHQVTGNYDHCSRTYYNTQEIAVDMALRAIKFVQEASLLPRWRTWKRIRKFD